MTDVQVLTPREVPLGGLRAMTVRRTLPARERSFVGAWCFVDHYGPDEVATTGGMDVAPHPHCGLATVSWLFMGEIERSNKERHDIRMVTEDATANYLTFRKELPGLEDLVPQYHIASYLGVTPVQLSRIRAKLVGRG